nr:aldo/keto reductase [bacterium]
MLHRPFGKIPENISPFGMGCMRLPTTKVNGKTVPDEAETARMIHHAIEQGVNYFDTAYGYHGGLSEIAVGKALEGGWRDKVYLTTKLPRWNVKVREDMDRILNEQLQKLRTDHLDFYLLHSLNGPAFDTLVELGVLEFLDRAKADGRIRYAGFSYHGSEEDFPRVIDAYDWNLAQIQFNYMDINNQAGIKGLHYAGQKGVPIVVMEGLLGGRLASVPPQIEQMFASYPVKRSVVEWAFRWLVNFPEVAVVLSGVSNMAQLEDNIRIFDKLDSGIMSQQELDLVANVREAFEKRIAVPCTGCRYCMPCPQGVDIPGNFALWNDVAKFGGWGGNKWEYEDKVEAGNGPDKCIACGKCQQVCPQEIAIIEKLKEFAKMAAE